MSELQELAALHLGQKAHTMTMLPTCQNCMGTGWVGYEVPGNVVDGVIHMRQRINPCHLCNAQGWKQWAQKIIDHAEKDADAEIVGSSK